MIDTPARAALITELERLNLSANTTRIRAWAKRHKVEQVLTLTSASWANPIEAQFGPLSSFTTTNSNYRQPHRARPADAGVPAPAQRQRANPAHP